MRTEEQTRAEELNPAQLGYAGHGIPWPIKAMWALYAVGAVTYLVIVLK